MQVRNIIISFFLCSQLITSHSTSVAKQVDIRKIPVAKGLASHPVNGGHCLISDGEYQYIAFYDGDHQLTVGQRKLSETNWDFAKLPERVGWDTHNKILLFQDRQGYLHLTGNMHCASLKYYRTKAPADIHTFRGIHTWAGDFESRVTYPTLFKLRDGSIYLMYRHGGSGNGMRILVHYDEETQRWTKSVPALTNGRDRSPTCNAYPLGLREDNGGVWHFAWCWRETPDVVTNFDVCYVRSLDRGVSWMTLDGRKLELPMTPENTGVVDPIPQKSGLMNGGTFVVDAEGHPYIGYTRFDKNGYNQLYIATPVGDTWKIIQLTDWTHRFYFEGRGSIPESPPTPRISIPSDQKIRISYSNRHATPTKGQFVLTRKQLLRSQPGQSPIQKTGTTTPAIPHIRAVNRGPLPPGQKHYMQQQTDRPNRDRKPETPREPTMIYLVEMKETG